MKQEINDQDVLLVKDKNESKLKAVKGFDENGKLETELSNQANVGSFFKIDSFANPLGSQTGQEVILDLFLCPNFEKNSRFIGLSFIGYH